MSEQTIEQHSTELLGIARFTFHDGRIGDFKRLSAQCLDIVRRQDTGTLQYDIFLNDDETEAVVLERYRDSAALVEHLGNVGDDLMSVILETGSVSGETLGRPSSALRAQLAGGPVRLFTPYLTARSPSPSPRG